MIRKRNDLSHAVHMAKSQHSIDWAEARVVRMLQGISKEAFTRLSSKMRQSKGSTNLDKGMCRSLLCMGNLLLDKNNIISSMNYLQDAYLC